MLCDIWMAPTGVLMLNDAVAWLLEVVRGEGTRTQAGKSAGQQVSREHGGLKQWRKMWGELQPM